MNNMNGFLRCAILISIQGERKRAAHESRMALFKRHDHITGNTSKLAPAQGHRGPAAYGWQPRPYGSGLLPRSACNGWVRAKPR